MEVQWMACSAQYKLDVMEVTSHICDTGDQPVTEREVMDAIPDRVITKTLTMLPGAFLLKG